MKSAKTRYLLHACGVFVVLLWLIMIGLLVKKTHFEPQSLEERVSANPTPVFSEPHTDWMEIYLNDKKVGFSKHRASELGQDYLLEEEIFLKLNMMGQVNNLTAINRSIVDQGFRLKNFSFHMSSGIVTFQVSGKVAEKRLFLEIGKGAAKRHKMIKLSAPPVMGSGITQFFRGQSLRVGTSYAFPFFDASTMTLNEIILRVVAKEPVVLNEKAHRAFRLEAEMWGQTMLFWVGEDGSILKEKGFMGLTLLKADQTQATEGITDSGVADLYRLAAVPVKNKLSSPERLTYLKIELSGMEEPDLARAFLVEERQHFADGILEIYRERRPLRASYSIPYRDPTGEMQDDLEPDFDIQSDDPAIIEKAREIRGHLKNPVAVSKKLVSWVYAHIEKRPMISVPSALETLKLKAGDCNEHAVLLAALLRASGIPARVCVGLVYSSGRFFYHAWNEAYLGDWVTMDATLDQVPADATHIKLAQGGLERQTAIIGMIGKLRLKVVDYKYD